MQVFRGSEDAQRLAPLLRRRVQVFLRNKSTAVFGNFRIMVKHPLLDSPSSVNIAWRKECITKSWGRSPLFLPSLGTCSPFDEDSVMKRLMLLTCAFSISRTSLRAKIRRHSKCHRLEDRASLPSSFSTSVAPEMWPVMQWLYSSSRSRSIFASNLHSESDVTRAGKRRDREDGTPHQ
jgi:hypothetical protein